MSESVTIANVANPLIVRDSRPALLPHRREPLLVRSGWGEVFSERHHRQAGGAEDVWKLSAKIAIGKESAVHAACS